MGAEQSSNNRSRLERENVEYILEQQRKLYEQRCRDLLRNHVTTQNNAQQGATRQASQPNPPRPVPATSLRGPQPALRQANNTVHQPNNHSVVNPTRPASQLNQTRPATAPLQPRANITIDTVHQPTNTSLDNQNRPASQPNPPRPASAATPLRPQPSPSANNTVLQPNNPSLVNLTRPASQVNQPRPATAPLRPQPPAARVNNNAHQANNPLLDNQNRFERNPAPYSYRQEDLQNGTEVNARSRNLYPNLNNNAPPAAGGPSTSSANFRFSNNSPSNVTPAAADFVFVNNNGTARTAPSAPRERSVSRSRDRNSGNEDLKCPTCKNIFTLYIFNCASGHSSCKLCKERGAACGACGLGITDVRNHALESYVAERKVPCLNKEDGCSLVFKLSEMEAHVKECPFKEMLCPLNAVFGQCLWRGKVNHIAAHFDNMHSAQRQAEEGQEMFLPNICIENKFVHLIVKGSFNFLVHVCVSEKDRMIYMTTQLIGTKVSAHKWTYSIQIYNKREPRRKYEFVDVCSSSSEPVNDIYKEARCATLPLSYAMNFVNEGAICYKFSMEKTFKGKNNFHNKNNRGRGGRNYS